MAGIYRITRPDGSTVYSDVPGGAGRIESMGPDGRAPSEQEHSSHDYRQAKDLIKEAQKRVPKLNAYFDYLDYLRNRRPLQFERVLRELQREEPQTWLKLQKYPQFRPLRETAIGLKAAQKHIGAASDLARGCATGSVEHWLETTVKDVMKRDRYGAYADVLGEKASTLPAPKPPTYSNTRLDQVLKAERARSAQAAKRSRQGFGSLSRSNSWWHCLCHLSSR